MEGFHIRLYTIFSFICFPECSIIGILCIKIKWRDSVHIVLILVSRLLEKQRVVKLSKVNDRLGNPHTPESRNNLMDIWIDTCYKHSIKLVISEPFLGNLNMVICSIRCFIADPVLNNTILGYFSEIKLKCVGSPFSEGVVKIIDKNTFPTFFGTELRCPYCS